MPKQEFNYMDLGGVLVVWCVFFAFLGVTTLTFINFCCIHGDDDVTVLEKWGHRKRLGIRLGVHKRHVIQRSIEDKKIRSDSN